MKDMSVMIHEASENVEILHGFHRKLHQWYGKYGRRDLPWRNTDDPYAIYISEIMLQQTQVKTVLERYYGPFLKRFPTVLALAEAAQDEVLQAWQGLGYYNRALNLHATAKQCGTALPVTVEALNALPGIGRNTAHAVAAFAFRQPVAVMEANVRRVLARIFALEHPTEPDLWDKAQLLLDRNEPFDYNQAMMDIGATVCIKRAPRCPECPAQTICLGQTSPESYPALKSKKAPPVRQKIITVLRNAKGQYHATPRDSRFLNGLYHFIETEFASPATAGMTAIGHVRQQYSHFTLEADIFIADDKNFKSNQWYSLAQLYDLPMSMAEQKILALLEAAASTND